MCLLYKCYFLIFSNLIIVPYLEHSGVLQKVITCEIDLLIKTKKHN